MGKKLKAWLLSGLSGILGLGIINSLAGITGFTLGSGWFVLCVSGILGLPGVVMLLFSRILMG